MSTRYNDKGLVVFKVDSYCLYQFYTQQFYIQYSPVDGNTLVFSLGLP